MYAWHFMRVYIGNIRCYMGIMEKKMETIGYIGFRVWEGSGIRQWIT